MRRWLFAGSFVLVGILAGCSSESKNNPDVAGGDAQQDVSQTETRSDTLPQDLTPDLAPDLVPDLVPDVADVVPDAADVAADEVEDTGPVGPLPFAIERPAEGEPLTPEEVTQFTKKLTGFYKKTGFFNWLYWTSHGLDESFNPDMPSYRLFWQDTRAYKEGTRVRFEHFGGADNLALRTAKLLENAAAGYLMTNGDPMFGRLVEGYSKGFVALSTGMDWSTEEPLVPYLQARAIFTHDHEYEMEGGRQVRVEYGPVKVEKFDWNAHTVANPLNPTYGDVWIRNMRSKDDVPHMYRMMPVLRKVVAEGKDASVREAAAQAIEYMEGFAKDIVDNGYQIRTKEDGQTFVPIKEDGLVNDLASFVLFESVIPNAECNAKFTSALLAYHEPLENDCGEADHNMYEDIAISGHYFNLAIIRFFHVAALHNAIAEEKFDRAEILMKGLIKRVERYKADTETPKENAGWYADMAAWLLAAATAGMPLTATETRLIVEQYSKSCEGYERFTHWDPWTDGTAEGQFEYVPDESVPVDPEVPDGEKMQLVRIQEMVFALEYCQSPYRHPASAPLFDCAIIADPSKWGE